MQDNNIFKISMYETPIPIFNCRTPDGREFLAMIDTGSEITIFDSKLLNVLEPTTSSDDSIVIHSMHGEEERDAVLYNGNLTMISDDNIESELSLTGICTDISSVSEFLKKSYCWYKDVLLILGSDSLGKLGWTIDFSRGNIIMQ